MSKTYRPPPHAGTAIAGLALFCWVVTSFPAMATAVERVECFGFKEISLQADGRHDNPLTDLAGHAVLTCPHGSVRSLPLFRDGGDTWKLRCAPLRTTYGWLAEPGRHSILCARACREYTP